jgi:lipoprotein NlpD
MLTLAEANIATAPTTGWAAKPPPEASQRQRPAGSGDSIAPQGTGPRSERAPAKSVAAPAPETAAQRDAPTPPLAAAGELPDPAVTGWRWPATGRILRGFDATLHKGIDLAGERGDPVRAAAAGRVVYAGTGIPGYGLMLILRHGDEYLSAYGHNDELLVVEGDIVRAGEEIARCGSSGTDGVKLHFEIRRGGRPVDPRGILPRR